MDYTLVKGTHDIYGEEAGVYQEIENIFKANAEVYGYNQFRTPIIEHTELFARGAGSSSDIVRKQMYTFDDKGGRSITLRPEGTASIARAIVNSKLYAEMDYPIRAYYCGPIFRYERPKAGTFRQFIQFGVENIGVDNPYMDVETILLAYRSLRMIGFKNIRLKINTLGDNESRENYRKALTEFFTPRIDKMCEDCKERLKLNPLRILDCKVPEDQEIVKDAPKMKDYLSEAAKNRFKKTLSLISEAQIPFEVDDNLVRGLDYYSHVVYEFAYTSESGLDVGALGGGGHYDHLLEEVGGPALAGVGFAFGLERIYAVLKEDNLLPNIEMGYDFMVMPTSDETISQGYIVGDYLRMLGYRTEVITEKKSFKAMFRKAEKHNTKYAIIVGDEEVKNNEVVVKDMHTQEQTKIHIYDLGEYVDSLFNEHDSHECCCGYDHGDDHECCGGHHHEEGHDCCCGHEHNDDHECCGGHHHEEGNDCCCGHHKEDK